MKLFGKKTLAMVLAVVMVMGMSVTAWAAEAVTIAVGEEKQLGDNLTGVTWTSSNTNAVTVTDTGEISGVAIGSSTVKATPTEPSATTYEWNVTVGEGTVGSITANKDKIEVPFGTDLNGAKTKLNAEVTVTAKNQHNGEFAVTPTWTCENWNGAVGTENTVTATYASKTDTVVVKVVQATIQSVTDPATVEVPAGATLDTVKGKLPTTVKVKLQDNSTKTLTVGTELNAWTTTYDATKEVAADYTYSTTLKDANYKFDTGVKIEGTVKAKAAWTLDTITVGDVVDGDGDTVSIRLDNKVYADVKALLGKDPSSNFTFTFENLDIGSADEHDGDFTLDLTSSEEEDLADHGQLSDEFKYKTTINGVQYSGTVKLTVYTSDVYDSFGKAPGTLSTIESAINTRLNLLYNDGLYEICFTEIDLEGGALYTNSDCDEEVYDDTDYSASELEDMYYVPNGTGEYSVLEYKAYADDDNDNELEGRIYLLSDEFLIIQHEMTTEDTLAFSAEEFEEAFLELDSDYYSLDYVTFSSFPNSKTAGYVYYGDDDTKAKSSAKYYVDPEDDDDKSIDELFYQPGTKGDVYSIQFTANGYDEDDKKVKVTGVYQITVAEVADITVAVDKNGTTEISASLFEDFLDENDKTFTEVVYVVFEGAPNDKLTSSSGKGCLEYDDDRISAPDGKKFFWIEDKNYDEDDDYLMDDVVFAGGKKDGTTRATFTVYGYKSSSNEKNERTSSLGSGSIDFVVGNANGSSNTLNGAIRGSETMKFAASLSAFEELGGRENEYITFTSLPVGGKLVYGWGTSAQEDVKAGTAYYLDYSAGKKTLSNVTFVPSYSSTKVQKTITIPFKAFNDKDRSVDGTINVTVTYSSYSTKFSDITTSTYADSVDFLYNQGITTGATASTFAPNNNVKRAEFVTFLWRAAGSPTVYGVTNKFTDVSASGQFGYAYNAILWAVQNGITTGRTSTTFAPGANVTHQELLTFLYRYDVNYLKHASNVSSYVNYTDWSSVQAYAQTPVKWADYKGILTGYAIQPNTPGTRATVALWLHRMLTL